MADTVRFHIVELWYPGSRVVGLTAEAVRLVDTQARNLISALDDAAIALSMFDHEYACKTQRLDAGSGAWDNESKRRQEIEAEVRNRLRVDRNDHSRFEEIRQTADLEFKREQWTSGHLPRSYSHRLIFVHARSYIFALHRLARCFAQIAEHAEAPKAATDEYATLVAAFPKLGDVRDSVAHYDERAVGKGRRGGTLKLKPVSNSMVHAPRGALIMESLRGRHFGCTLADGHYGEIEISIDRLSIAADCVQRMLDAFEWQGPGRHLPD